MEKEEQVTPTDSPTEDSTSVAESSTSATGQEKVEKIGLSRQIQSDGKKVFQQTKLIRVISLVGSIVVLILLIAYGASILVNEVDSFPITISNIKISSISISETDDMSLATTNLHVPMLEEMNNSSALYLPGDIDGDYSGSHNGDSYIAYTFYVKNNGEKAMYVNEKITVTSVLRNVDEAIRVRLYRDGVPTTYAKLAKNGEPEYGTVPFTDEETVFNEESSLNVGEIHKYTIVIWLEGDDPECVEQIAGGSMRFYMEFDVLER